MRNYKAVDIAWAAGLFEGEGTVFSHKNGTGIELRVSMSDREPIARFATAFGVNMYGPFKVTGPNGPNTSKGLPYKPQWSVSIRNRVRVREIFGLLRQWLSPRRTAQFERALRSIRPQRVMQGESRVPDCSYAKPKSQAGYKRHRVRKEQPCNACLREYAVYMRGLPRKRKQRRAA